MSEVYKKMNAWRLRVTDENGILEDVCRHSDECFRWGTNRSLRILDDVDSPSVSFAATSAALARI